MAVLVVAAHDNAALKEATAKVLSAAQALGGEIDILVAGENCAGVADAAAKFAGVRKVLLADAATLAKQMAEPLEALVTPLMAGYAAVLFSADTTGKNAAPRIAAKLDVMQLSNITAVEGPGVFVRPIYAGNAMLTVQSTDAKQVITVQATAFKAAPEGGGAPVETIATPGGQIGRAHV